MVAASSSFGARFVCTSTARRLAKRCSPPQSRRPRRQTSCCVTRGNRHLFQGVCASGLCVYVVYIYYTCTYIYACMQTDAPPAPQRHQTCLPSLPSSPPSPQTRHEMEDSVRHFTCPFVRVRICSRVNLECCSVLLCRFRSYPHTKRNEQKSAQHFHGCADFLAIRTSWKAAHSDGSLLYSAYGNLCTMYFECAKVYLAYLLCFVAMCSTTTILLLHPAFYNISAVLMQQRSLLQ